MRVSFKRFGIRPLAGYYIAKGSILYSWSGCIGVQELDEGPQIFRDAHRMKRIQSILVMALALLAGRAAASETDPGALKFFEEKIRPILAENCYSCHSVASKKLKGKLYLDSREGVARGGENGAIVVPGDPDKSRLILAVRYKLKDQEMPPDGPLKAAEVAALEAWVKMGCPDPRTSEVKLPALNARVIDVEKKAGNSGHFSRSKRLSRRKSRTWDGARPRSTILCSLNLKRRRLRRIRSSTNAA